MEEMIELTTEHRPMKPFESIKFHGGAVLILRPGDEYKVEVSAENEALISKLTTKVRRGKLHIHFRSWRVMIPGRWDEVEVIVQAPDLKKIDFTGAGKVLSQEAFRVNELKVVSSGVGGMNLNLDAQAIKVNLSGTGDVRLSGQSERLNINLSGIGNIDAGALIAQDVQIKASGIGGCDVHADRNLKIRASSIGNIRYQGEAKVDSRFSGLGKVERI